MPEYGKVRTRVKHGKTLWYLDFSPEVRGSQRFLWGVLGSGFVSFADADTMRRRICDRVSQGRPLSDAIGEFRKPDARPHLISTWTERWLESVGDDLAPKTLRDYKSIVKLHFGFWAGKSIWSVEGVSVEDWMRERRDAGVGAKARKNMLVPFRSMWRYARARNKGLVEPVWPRVKVARKRAKGMPLEDVRAALSALKPEDRGLYLCMFWTCCRPGEARGLTMAAYDWKTGRLEIAEALKTASGRDAVRGGTKTGNVRDYLLPGDLREWIKTHRSGAALDRGAPLFPNPRTGTPYADGRVRKLWVAACEAGGVEYVNPYVAFKHGGATRLLELGVALSDVQALLGHSDPGTTLIYDIDDRQRRDRAVSEMERATSGLPATSGEKA